MIKRNVIIAVLLIGMILGCKSDPPPVPKPEPDKVLVIFIGGWEGDQTRELADYTKINCPYVDVAQFSNYNGYKDNLAGFVKKSKFKKLLVVGHSFGFNKVVEDADKGIHIDEAIGIDPVAYDWGDLKIKGGIDKALIFRRKNKVGIPRATITGPVPIEVVMIEGGHNAGPHDISVMERIKREVETFK